MADATQWPKFVVFEDTNDDDERMAAVLVVKDARTGDLKAHVKDVPDREPPDPEIVTALVQSVEIRNL